MSESNIIKLEKKLVTVKRTVDDLARDGANARGIGAAVLQLATTHALAIDPEDCPECKPLVDVLVARHKATAKGDPKRAKETMLAACARIRFDAETHDQDALALMYPKEVLDAVAKVSESCPIEIQFADIAHERTVSAVNAQLPAGHPNRIKDSDRERRLNDLNATVKKLHEQKRAAK